VTETTKTLYLLRHAKAKPPARDQRDAERELTGRGRRAAAALGSRAATVGPLPDLVLTSPAARAVATAAEWARAAGFPAHRITRHDRIYQARVGTLLALIRNLDENLESVLLVGHNPTFSELAGQLAGRYLALRTCAMAVFRITGPWARTAAAGAQLLGVERPD
jgi:phosphohistidine phosphatase